MKPSTVAMALAGSLNLLLALGWMAFSILGSNGFGAQRGSWFLNGVALLLLLAWAGGLYLARHWVHWGQARGWGSLLAVTLASAGAMAAFLLVVAVVTFAMAVAATSHPAKPAAATAAEPLDKLSNK